MQGSTHFPIHWLLRLCVLSARTQDGHLLLEMGPIIFLPSPEDMFIDFREREREGEREEEKHGCERETSISCLLYVPQLVMEPATLACALTGNQTHSCSVYRTTLQPSEPHRPGQNGPYFILILAERCLKEISSSSYSVPMT